jgi:enolase
MNVINGGAHAGNALSVQEFFIIPVGAETFADALKMGVETYTELKRVLQTQFGAGATNVGDEGGFAPPLNTSCDALDAMTNAVDRAGYAKEMWLGIDCAASEFYDTKKNVYAIDGQQLSASELSDYYTDLVDRYPVKVIEDPFNEEAFEDFAKITSRLKGTTIVGDDLFVTNVQRLSKGIGLGAANALLLKLNQIGTISEAFDAATLAFRNGYSVVVSHRSGETEDTTIADVSVALGSELIKTGAPARSERNAKYNQLLRIQEYLGDGASYQGLKMKHRRKT